MHSLIHNFHQQSKYCYINDAHFSISTFQKFAHFLALLPKANKGDAGSWSLMMQKLLISINVHLNNFFQGLEEGNLLISLFLFCLFVWGYSVLDRILWHVLQKQQGKKQCNDWLLLEETLLCPWEVKTGFWMMQRGTLNSWLYPEFLHLCTAAQWC